MQIPIVKHNRFWKLYYEREAQKVLVACHKKKLNAKVEHIGSTAIEGLSAKPTIDMMMVVPVGINLDDYIAALRKVGYIYVSKYNDVMPFRRFFIKIKPMATLDQKRREEIKKEDEMPARSSFERLFHIHVIHEGTLFERKHIAFRNHLRRNQVDRTMYEQLKKHLAKQNWYSEADYAQAKAPFIQSVLLKLGFED